jgi:pimeloyl-ACP methyl ester carboxylesterase
MNPFGGFMLRFAFAALLVSCSLACLRQQIDDSSDSSSSSSGWQDAITYRDLSSHPGCSTKNLAYPAAQIPGFACAAEDLTTNEDTTKPIVLLVHGNSDSPLGWEKNSTPSCTPQGAMEGAPMLAETLAASGYKVLALDMRHDLVDDPAGNNDTENAAQNMDHGWGVPLAEHFIGSVLSAYPNRHVDLIGFSFGVTVIRDALRRLDVNEGVDVWSRVDNVILLAGGNHGVSTYSLCATNPTMRGKVTCEMGDRAAYTPTKFLSPLNGDQGAWETPCSSSSPSAFGRDVCGGHVVKYTTVVMQDISDGTQQDPFVSQASSQLNGADNETVSLTDFDESDYFFCGLFKDHYGSCRSSKALSIITKALGN